MYDKGPIPSFVLSTVTDWTENTKIFSERYCRNIQFFY